MQVDYFKRHQRDGIYHFIKVVGGPSKTRDGYQEVITKEEYESAYQRATLGKFSVC